MELVHNLLLKKAKEESYSALEIEQVLRAQEEVLIQFYLDRK
ncbi:MAG: peptidyl-prolyl cis-trans isomerase, partial [Fusobacterium necrophorum]|nr:peptidyl-prolyl cis-trans isomerase [Fusobacterium necrophorum]